MSLIVSFSWSKPTPVVFNQPRNQSLGLWKQESQDLRDMLSLKPFSVNCTCILCIYRSIYRVKEKVISPQGSLDPRPATPWQSSFLFSKGRRDKRRYESSSLYTADILILDHHYHPYRWIFFRVGLNTGNTELYQCVGKPIICSIFCLVSKC